MNKNTLRQQKEILGDLFLATNELTNKKISDIYYLDLDEYIENDTISEENIEYLLYDEATYMFDILEFAEKFNVYDIKRLKELFDKCDDYITQHNKPCTKLHNEVRNELLKLNECIDYQRVKQNNDLHTALLVQKNKIENFILNQLDPINKELGENTI